MFLVAEKPFRRFAIGEGQGTARRGVEAGKLYEAGLIAQALAEGLSVVTADPVFSRYGIPAIAA